MPDEKPLIVERVTWRTAAGAVAIVLVGVCVLYAASRDDLWTIHPVLHRLFEHLGALIFVTGLLHASWELYGKRVFLDEVLAKAGVAQSARTMGLIAAYVNFQSVTEWPELFAQSSQLDILVSYARTWRNLHLEELREFVKTPGARLRLVMPDPQDDAAVAALAERYATSMDEVRGRIAEAATEFASLASNDIVHIWYMRGTPMYSWYRFGHEGVISFYNHQVDRSPVPAFLVHEGGIFFTFANADFEKLLASDRVRRVTG